MRLQDGAPTPVGPAGVWAGIPSPEIAGMPTAVAPSPAPERGSTLVDSATGGDVSSRRRRTPAAGAV
jgi:hypothetical protein